MKKIISILILLFVATILFSGCSSNEIELVENQQISTNAETQAEEDSENLITEENLNKVYYFKNESVIKANEEAFPEKIGNYVLKRIREEDEKCEGDMCSSYIGLYYEYGDPENRDEITVNLMIISKGKTIYQDYIKEETKLADYFIEKNILITENNHLLWFSKNKFDLIYVRHDKIENQKIFNHELINTNNEVLNWALNEFTIDDEIMNSINSK